MADVTSIYGNPIKDAVARADIAQKQHISWECCFV